MIPDKLCTYRTVLRLQQTLSKYPGFLLKVHPEYPWRHWWWREGQWWNHCQLGQWNTHCSWEGFNNLQFQGTGFFRSLCSAASYSVCLCVWYIDVCMDIHTHSILWYNSLHSLIIFHSLLKACSNAQILFKGLYCENIIEIWYEHYRKHLEFQFGMGNQRVKTGMMTGTKKGLLCCWLLINSNCKWQY